MSEPTPAAAPPPETDTGRLDGASRARIFSVVAVIVLFAEIAPMQYTMVAPAARIIEPSFPGVGSNISWMTIIFGLVGGASTPLLGKLSDLYGKRLMLLAVGVAFIVGTLLCATTHSWALFLVGRGLEAVAIAAATIAYGLIRDLVPRRYVPLSIGLVSTGLGISALLGPLLSGYLTEHYSYQSLFWFLLVFTVLVMPFLMWIVPESKFRVKQRLDPVGALLLSCGVGSALVYLSNGAVWGWTKPTSYGYLVLGLVLLVGFFAVEKRAVQPIIDMKLLFSPNVSNVLFLGFFAAIVVGLQGYSIPFMALSPTKAQLLQQTQTQAVAQSHGLLTMSSNLHIQIIGAFGYGLGFSLLAYAAHISIWGATTGMFTGAGAGHYSGRRGARLPLLLSMIVFTGTSAVYAAEHTGWVTLVVIGSVFGLGFGGYYATTPNLLVEASPPEQQGITAGMGGVMNSIGTAVGTGLAAAFQNANPLKIVAGGRTTLVGTPGSDGVVRTAEVFTDKAYTESFIACAVAGLFAVAITWQMKSGRTPATGGLGYLSTAPAKPVPAVAE